MMTAAKNGVVTTATAIVTTDKKARGLGNFIAADQSRFHLRYPEEALSST